MSKELIEKREKLVVDARAALDEIKKNTDEARAAELEKRHDDIMAEFDKLDGQIAREQRTADAEKRLEERAAEERAKKRPVGDGEGRGQDEGDKVDYRHAFHRYVQVAGDMSALSDEERAALRAGVAPKEARAQTVGTNTAGGYTVPTELSNQIIVSMKAWGPMYDEDICTAMNTSSGNPIDIPTIDDTGVAVAKHTEAGDVTDEGDPGRGDRVMGTFLALIPKPLLYGALAALAGAALLTGVYAHAHHAGRQAERQAILERSVDLLRERNQTDDQIRSMDDAGLCAALGGRVSGDGRCQ